MSYFCIATRVVSCLSCWYPWRNGLSYFWVCIVPRIVSGLGSGEFFWEMLWVFFKCAIVTRLFLACVVKFPWRNGLSYFATCIATRAVFGLHCREILWRKELSYFGMCIATKFVLCLCCQGSSKNWVTIECALQNGLFLAWVIETIQRSGLSYFWICIAIRVVCCLSRQKKCLKSIVRHFSHVQYFFC